MDPPPASPLRHGTTTARLWTELFVLFVLLPLAACTVRRTFGRWVLPILLVSAALLLLVLLRDPAFDRARLWNARGWRASLVRSLRRLALGGSLLLVLMLVLRPERLFAFARERPGLFAFVLVAYPVLSVYPQELVFRTFLFHRYRSLVRGERPMILLSGLAFGLAHAFLWNGIALVLSTLGGLLFASTYARTRSTLQASIEHSLWGDLLFTLGLGIYFYGGRFG
jgi:hypothetical protein